MTIRRVSTSLGLTVYEAALDRVRFVFDNCDDVIVSMSGGKDSTVLLHLARRVATELGRLPLKVQWLDQEAEWQATADFMRGVMYSPDVSPFWFQFPWRLTNSLSATDDFLYCWNPKDRDIWIRDQDPISIKENRFGCDLFEDVIKVLATGCDTRDKQHVGVLVGMRMAESVQRRISIGWSRSGDYAGAAKSNFKGITWSRAPVRNTRVFWPIYDWLDKDVWVCIAQNDLAYNRIYDKMFQYGVTPRMMRVSALIHETSWHFIRRLQEMEPETYARYLRRIHGTSAFAHFGEDIMPRQLPAPFKDWQEYRDYLLIHLIEPKYHALFRKRWKRKSLSTGDLERWHKMQVKELLINDIEGKLTDNARGVFKLADRKKNDYYRNQTQERIRQLSQ
jgi:predicted phosphoadenosine phosphosulfate sulfurtransferase